MSRPAHSLPAGYFEEKYAADPDPWRFATSAYEAEKYVATLKALPRHRYASALELGCSIGVLTAQLARRCGRLLALDVAERALQNARTRCRDLPHVGIERRRVPDEFPQARFDLVVMSEVGYYLCQDDLMRTLALIRRSMAPPGHFLLVHWTPEDTDYPLTGDQVHELALAARGFRPLVARRQATWRLDLLERSEA